jgi:gluconate 2-dehydrogenase gamma chain
MTSSHGTGPAITRRQMLTGGLLAGSALVYPAPLRALEYSGGLPWAAGAADYPPGWVDRRFLTAAEIRTIEAITERLIPADADGPGARDAGVVRFIDSQLAGWYGRGQRWYMQGPFPEPLDTQGYQTHHTPAQLIREGLTALDAHVRSANADADFASLPEEQQIAILQRLENQEINFDSVPGALFFSFLLEMTIEGYFCDPVHGGNRDMAGWRYVGFPGARYDYRDFTDHGGARIDLHPVGLTGAPEWSAP